MLTLAIWLICAIGAGLIANAKGRRVWLWILLGFLIGIFAVIIIACLPKVQEMKMCPKCSNKIPQTALVCHYCYHDFKAEADKIRELNQ